ncbi:Trans-cinnamate 4-monooxygenase [Zea mays]|uniref:Trans-cinnamate 4-monooxygenase n=2 Tax=Zea mays TaxID=4577 RepID=A0A1D6FME4_MAIZE|nr:Trans-cinnamate 4-monooxygenase [Zea mays]
MDLALLEKALLGLFAAAVVAIAVAKLTGKRYRLPPGPPGAPVVGNWLQVGDDLNHRNLMAMAKRFGDIFLLRMGVRNLVVVSTPELAKEVLHTQGVEFGSRTRNVVFDIFTGKGQDMVFTVYGDHWRKMRRIMTVPFFTNKVVAQNRAGWEEEARLVVEDVRKDPEAAAGGVVLRRRLQLMMYNDMFRIMFDRRFDSEHDPLFNKLKALNAERSRLSQSFEYNYGDFIPVLRPFLRGYLNRFQDPRQCLVPRQRPQEVGAPRRVPARALPGGGEVRGGPRQRLPIRALWGRPPELPWDHPRAAYHRHHPGPAGAELPAAAAAGAGQDRHHGEARPVQQPDRQACHHRLQAPRGLEINACFLHAPPQMKHYVFSLFFVCCVFFTKRRCISCS